MADHSGDRYSERDYGGNDEGYWCQRNSLIESVKPIAHQPPGDWPGDDIRNHHRSAELPYQQANDVTGPRTEHLPDANLLGAPLGCESGKPEQAETTDDRSQQRKCGENL